MKTARNFWPIAIFAVFICFAAGMTTMTKSATNPAAIPAASRIFGRGKTMAVHRVEDLPGRLSELYFRLARR